MTMLIPSPARQCSARTGQDWDRRLDAISHGSRRQAGRSCSACSPYRARRTYDGRIHSGRVRQWLAKSSVCTSRQGTKRSRLTQGLIVSLNSKRRNPPQTTSPNSLLPPLPRHDTRLLQTSLQTNLPHRPHSRPKGREPRHGPRILASPFHGAFPLVEHG